MASPFISQSPLSERTGITIYMLSVSPGMLVQECCQSELCHLHETAFEFFILRSSLFTLNTSRFCIPVLALFEIQMKSFAFLLAFIETGIFMSIPNIFLISSCISLFCLLGLPEMISARCFNSTSFTIWRSFSPLSLSCNCCAERAVMRMIFCGAAFSSWLSLTENVPLSDIHDDSGSDEQIVSPGLALFHLNQSAEWFGLR